MVQYEFNDFLNDEEYEKWVENVDKKEKRKEMLNSIVRKTFDTAADITKVTVGVIIAYEIINHKDMPTKVIETLLERSLKNRGLI